MVRSRAFNRCRFLQDGYNNTVATSYWSCNLTVAGLGATSEDFCGLSLELGDDYTLSYFMLCESFMEHLLICADYRYDQTCNNRVYASISSGDFSLNRTSFYASI